MIQLQIYLNSSANLQSRDLFKVRKNLLICLPRRVIKSVSQPKPRYQTPQKPKNQSLALNKSRNRYEQLMKLIRDPIKFQLKNSKLSPQKQAIQIRNSVHFKSQLKPKFDREQNMQKCGMEKIADQQRQVLQKQISKTLIPNKGVDITYNSSCLRKYSTKTEAQQHKAKILFKKRKTTILKRILDPKHLNHVRQILNSNIQIGGKDLEEKNQNLFELKCSYEALERLKKEYELKPIKRQKSRKKLAKIPKLSNLNRSSGQNIAGWTTKQFTD